MVHGPPLKAISFAETTENKTAHKPAIRPLVRRNFSEGGSVRGAGGGEVMSPALHRRDVRNTTGKHDRQRHSLSGAGNREDYMFKEHIWFNVCDKQRNRSAFLSNFRNLLVMEQSEGLWLARGTPGPDWNRARR